MTPEVREIAEWLVAQDYPIDFNFDAPPPVALRQAVFDVIHEDKTGQWHGNQLSHEDAAWWICEEAGWPLPGVASNV